MSRCKSCGARIHWIEMDSGKIMPVDFTRYHYKRVAKGGDTLVTEDGRVIQNCEIIDDYRLPYGYISHFYTCPYAAQHRRSR